MESQSGSIKLPLIGNDFKTSLSKEKGNFAPE
jgi:hypothetical protein